jgi:hypothetical protein
MPKSLHAELAGRADAGQVSLNQLIVGALAENVAGEPSRPAAPRPAPRPGSRALPRAVRVALALNGLVVAVAAVAALLIVAGAWHPG